MDGIFASLSKLFAGLSSLLTFKITAWDSKYALDILAGVFDGLAKMFGDTE